MNEELAPMQISEDCLPLPEPFPSCERCGSPLTLAVTPWPAGGLVLRWLCFDRGAPEQEQPPCADAPLRDGAMPGLVPHPDSRVLVTRTQLIAWYAELDAAAAEILTAHRLSRRQSVRRVEPAVRRIAAVLEEIAPRIDPEIAPPTSPAARNVPDVAEAPSSNVPEGLLGELNPINVAAASNPAIVDGVLEEAGACPTCGARGDAPCVTSSGAVSKRPHAKRAQA